MVRAHQFFFIRFSFSVKCSFLAIVVLLLSSIYYFSAFTLGIVVGVLCTLSCVWVQNFLWPSRFSDQSRCHISGLPLGELCCSVHCDPNSCGSGPASQPYWPVYAPALPPLRTGTLLLRDLQSFGVPHMNDEDPNSSASAGPLGSGLGFQLDKNARPIYKGWMNEAVTYDPETHHVNQTHSVFVTLDGAQLRLQRPKRNVARRSMWNEELPSVGSARFQSQRIFDLTHAQVVLLPAGLVCKRLWSKKYPISITFSSQSEEKNGATAARPLFLISSTSVPNMDFSVTRSSNDKFDSPVAPKQSFVEANGHPSEDTFVVVPRTTLPRVLFLFGRTCREKEAWYRRFRAASLGVPLLWTPQLAVQMFLSGTNVSTSKSVESRSDDEECRSEPGCTTDLSPDISPADILDKSSIGLPPCFTIPSSREPLYVSYVRYMAKFMPATWLMRGARALRINVNYISCDPSLTWLNALIARMFWDFLREAYWLERVRDKIQAKLKKIHLPGFISDLIVVGIDLGSELPVIRHIGRPYLDAHGLWLELDIAYAGGFSVALETNVNLLRWNQRSRVEWEAANLADDISNEQSPSVSISIDSPSSKRSNRLGAFISDEEDSVDSTTDSDTPSDHLLSVNSFRRSSGSGRSSGPVSQSAVSASKSLHDDRAANVEPSFQLASALPTRKRIIRIMDRITKSSYFQKAVDNKLVQRGMELLSNTPIVLEAEIQSLSGTLLVNIPPPPSDRLWYGFRPNPQLRIKARPRVGEKAVTMSRILEWIENRVALEFQRLIVLPNMDDISIPLLLSDVVAGGTK